MLFGRVKGTAVCTLKYPGTEGLKLLVVQPLNKKLEPVGPLQVAADVVEAGAGRPVRDGALARGRPGHAGGQVRAHRPGAGRHRRRAGGPPGRRVRFHPAQRLGSIQLAHKEFARQALKDACMNLILDRRWDIE